MGRESWNTEDGFSWNRPGLGGAGAQLPAAYPMVCPPEVCGLKQVLVQRHVDCSPMEESGIKTQIPCLSARLFLFNFFLVPSSGSKKLYNARV